MEREPGVAAVSRQAIEERAAAVPEEIVPEPSRGNTGLLRVLLDARKLWDGGIGVYTENLIAGLVGQCGVELGIIVPPAMRSSPRFARYAWRDAVEVIEDEAPPYSYDEMVGMPRRLPFKDYDVYHAPHYTLPFGVPIPSVVTVHDLIHMRYPEKIYYPLIAKHMIKSALNRAARVLTVSQATLDELSGLFSRPAAVRAKLRLVPNALDPYFLRDCSAAEYLASRFRLYGPFLVSVFSTLKPHKGLRDLLQAFHNLKRAVNASSPAGARAINDFKLVLIGQGMHSGEINRLLDETGGVDDVYLLGEVSKEDLVNLYAGAAALVMPSLAEGFGLPVIEAQAQGTPVIARPVPAFRDVLGARDIVCSDFSVPALERGIAAFVAAYARGELREKVKRKEELLARFDRHEIARAVLQVYREAAEPATRPRRNPQNISWT